MGKKKERKTDEKFWCFPLGKVQAIMNFVSSVSVDKKLRLK